MYIYYHKTVLTQKAIVTCRFAAEVFHGLQEQVTTTASRSHKLMVRIQHIEAALPPLEKAVLAQTSHIHFAYTAGMVFVPHVVRCLLKYCGFMIDLGPGVLT